MEALTAAAFYEPLGDGRFRSTERTEGPWSPLLQHGGPPCALLARTLERCEPRDDLHLSRITIEFLGPVPVAELEVVAEVERPGRSVELLRAELRAGGRTALRASAWRLAGAPVDRGTRAAVPELPTQESPPPNAIAETGYLRSIEWRSVAGDWQRAGPATVWARPRVPLIEGEAMSGLQRLMCVVDSSSGISAELPWVGWQFINTDLSVHLTRQPLGDWILLDAATTISEGGAGLAAGSLGDLHGRVGRSAQTLLVRKTGPA